ncbi:MAG: Polyphosphate glucokinase [Verrucomicrobiaceae bacterium]|nr:Polyphosphate glucokinase [Verrucomicrobiaceae bacterium]
MTAQAATEKTNVENPVSKKEVQKKTAAKKIAPKKVESKKSTAKISTSSADALKILSIDIGGTGLKASLIDSAGKMLVERLRIATPYPCPPQVMVDTLVELVKPLQGFQRIAIGFPGVVRNNSVLTAPHFGVKEWAGFPLAAELSKRLGKKPAKLINDADMQGLAVISGKGLELVVTLGTGVGTALFRDGELMPHLELAQHPLRGKKTYNDYVGDHTLKRIGIKRWRRRVTRVVDVLNELLHYERLYIGGGNAQKIGDDLLNELIAKYSDGTKHSIPIKIVSNDAGIEGGAGLWRTP